MALHVLSASIQGIDAHTVLVQIDSAPGIHSLTIVGLADKAVQESRERVNSALRNSGYTPPEAKNRRYTINLSPADSKKEGALFDLPIAVACLLESRQLDADVAETLFAGELALDGTLSPIRGALSMALLAKQQGFKKVIVPQENAQEAAFVSDIDVFGARSLGQVVRHLNGESPLNPEKDQSSGHDTAYRDDTFAFIRGQHSAKRALTIAAAGNHNIFMRGAPGSGKTILARSLRGLLPPLSHDEIIESAKIHSAVGLLKGSPADLQRPFRSPHHTSSSAALVGGGTWPRPGEISLAHRGVLFLDEFPEFARNVLESLRQPLEDGVVSIARASGTLELPAAFLLVSAMNPCPCGNSGDPRLTCTCSPAQVAKYGKKVSGPLLDRMDIQILVPRETVHLDSFEPDFDSLAQTRESIKRARDIQALRLSGTQARTNGEISFKYIENVCPMSGPSRDLLELAVNKKNLSQRAVHKTRRVSMTIADLEGAEIVQEHHVAEAISLRLTGPETQWV